MRRLHKAKFRVALIQLNATSNWERNLEKVNRLLSDALSSRPSVIALPEVFSWRGPSSDLKSQANDVFPLILKRYRTFAKKRRTALLLGSLVEPSPTKGKYFNTSYLIDMQGRIAAKYRKIHLFDNKLGKDAATKESKHILPGSRIVTCMIQGVRAGLSICYDLRFPELYRKQMKKGAQILFIPANFTRKTGVAHWETLLRARAIENQAFVIAPAQVGRHPANQIMSYGNSMVVDPWGKVLCRGSNARDEILTVDLNLVSQKQLRTCFPVTRHAKML